MTKTSNSKQYDLEERSLQFAIQVIKLCRQLPQNPINRNLIDQLVRSSSSVGANYREANDALGKKDFVLRIKISRKEAKETVYWLQLINEANPTFNHQISILMQECTELRNILSAIINKVTS